MNSITESVLVESQSARNASILNVSNDRALETLCKAKALVMAFWQGTGVATNAQLAEFYEISEEVVRDNIRRNKEEFEADGLKLLKGKALKDVCELISQSQNRVPSLTIWTPRAALRLGMLLRDSKIAQKVRSLILDIVEIANPVKTIPTVEDINNVVDIIFRGTDVHINVQSAIKLNAIEKNHPEYWQVCADARKQLSVKVDRIFLKVSDLAKLYNDKYGYLTANQTELGEAKALNKLLIDRGYQIKNASGNPNYLATDTGKKYSETLLDTAPGHGKSILALKWSEDILAALG